MKFNSAPIFLAVVLPITGAAWAQKKAESEVIIHENVRLILAAVPQEMPKSLQERYQYFLPMFEEVLKEKTSDRQSAGAVTIRVVPAVKEIGTAKTKRAIARITAYRRDSKREYVGNFLIYSYATGDTVTKEEIGQFLDLQILGPMGVGR